MKILSFYNQNRKFIWIAIITIIFIIMVIHALNNIAKENNENAKNIIKENIVSEHEYEENKNINEILTQESVKKEEDLTIDQFVRYCNAKNITEAYSLLSDECKKNIYPTIDIFKTNYINRVYTETKLYSKEHYKGNTYQVKLYSDMSSTGMVTDTYLEDYITLVKNSDNTKLNISSYIGEEIINKTYKTNNLQIDIVKKNIYKEYEEYTFEISNLTKNEIQLDSFEKTKNIYLTGGNGNKYYCAINEKSNNDLTIPSYVKKTIILKFNKDYGKTTVIDQEISFSDIIFDKTNSKERDKLTLNIK